jgi:hypothetical protein
VHWTLDLFDAHRLQFLITIHSIALSLFHTVCLKFTAPRLNSLGLPSIHWSSGTGSNGINSPSWIPELSPWHSHSYSLLPMHSLELHLELLPLISCCSVWSSLQLLRSVTKVTCYYFVSKGIRLSSRCQATTASLFRQSAVSSQY